MTVFGHSGGGFLAGKQVFPVDCEAEVSQRLLEASHSGDLRSALECITDPFVDVNFIGVVCLKAKRAEVLLRDESAIEVREEYEEFKTEVSALFLAVHAGNVALVRKLLVTWLISRFIFFFISPLLLNSIGVFFPLLIVSLRKRKNKNVWSLKYRRYKFQVIRMGVWALFNAFFRSHGNRDGCSIQSDFAFAMLCLLYRSSQHQVESNRWVLWLEKTKAFSLLFYSFFLGSIEFWTWWLSFMFPSLSWHLAFCSVEPVFCRFIFRCDAPLETLENKEIKLIVLDFSDIKAKHNKQWQFSAHPFPFPLLLFFFSIFSDSSRTKQILFTLKDFFYPISNAILINSMVLPFA